MQQQASCPTHSHSFPKQLLYLVLTLCLASCGPETQPLSDEQLRGHNPEKTYVEIDGVTLHYRQTGLGRPLIFLHGVLGDYRMWRHVTPGLTYGNTVYELDLMGFGFSEKPQDKTYNLKTYVAQLHSYIENFHLDNLVLAGHDFGAVIAAGYAVEYPENVHKLILMSAPLSLNENLPVTMRLLGLPLLGKFFTGDWMLTRILKEGVFDEEIMSPAMIKQYLEPFREDPGARGSLHKFFREFDLYSELETNILPRLDNLTMPTLLLWGGQDPYTPMDIGRELDNVIASADLQVVTQSGHYILEDRPEDVRAQIKEWIDR